MEASRLPAAESLEDTMVRVIDYWGSTIVPRVREGENILLVAHGNTLRALIKHLEGISEEAVMELNIPTGIPLVYEFDDALRVTGHHYLADSERLQAAIEQVAHQTSAA
jgi:2,3-bisphosphoglycerate-dependent phosphoglycerate mutase